MSAVDNESPPGSWAREMKARGIYSCEECGWTGRQPSVTDASSAVERNGRMEMDRTHLLICPSCHKLLHRRDAQHLAQVNGGAAPPVAEKCEDALLPDGPKCPRCGGRRGPSGIGGGSWVHF